MKRAKIQKFILQTIGQNLSITHLVIQAYQKQIRIIEKSIRMKRQEKVIKSLEFFPLWASLSRSLI